MFPIRLLQTYLSDWVHVPLCQHLHPIPKRRASVWYLLVCVALDGKHTTRFLTNRGFQTLVFRGTSADKQVADIRSLLDTYLPTYLPTNQPT